MVTSPAVPPYSSTTMAIWTCLRWNSFSSSGTRLVSGTKVRRTDERPDWLVPGRVALHADQVLHEHDAQDVIEVFRVDRDARVFLLAEERAQLVERCVGMDRDHVGARRHHLTHKRVAEVDNRPEQPALVSFDEPLFLPRFEVGVRRFPRVRIRGRRRAAVGFHLRAARIGRDDAHQAAGQRVQEACGHVERRQQHLEHPLGIAPDDQERKQVLAEQDEHRDEEQQHPDRLESRASRQDRGAHRREREDDAEHQPRGNEELDRIVEVETEAIGAATALGHQAQRQPHERAERGLDGADVDGGHGEQEEDEWGHLLLRVGPHPHALSLGGRPTADFPPAPRSG